MKNSLILSVCWAIIPCCQFWSGCANSSLNKRDNLGKGAICETPRRESEWLNLLLLRIKHDFDEYCLRNNITVAELEEFGNSFIWRLYEDGRTLRGLLSKMGEDDPARSSVEFKLQAVDRFLVAKRRAHAESQAVVVNALTEAADILTVEMRKTGSQHEGKIYTPLEMLNSVLQEQWIDTNLRTQQLRAAMIYQDYIRRIEERVQELEGVRTSLGETAADAGTNSPPRNFRLLWLHGSNADNTSLYLREFTSINSPRTQEYLKDFSIFAVRRGGPIQVNAERGSLLIKNGDFPTYFENMDEAAAFLSKRIGAVKTKEEAEEILLLLPEMFSYKVVTKPPVSRDEKQPDAKKPPDWTRLFKRTETGWMLTCTLLVDPDISLCNRVTISLNDSGTLNISKPRCVYITGQYH